MKQTNSAVVLLCGGKISPASEWRSGARIDLAVKLACEHGSFLLVSSGVSGHEKNIHACPEAHLYIQELVRRYPEFSKRRLLVEDFSRDTVGNVYFSLQVLRSVLGENATVHWVSNSFHKQRLASIVSRHVQLKHGHGSWHHQFACVPDIDGQADLIEEIYSNELASQTRFENDLRDANSVENLLFRHHDFYSIKKLWKGLACA